ncbi:hypothetical protein BDR04DRAFT_971673, partial [Suillus decipiens]
YTIQDLEHVILSMAESDIFMETELLHYYRQFHPIAVWLEANLKISTRECNQYFWHGLPHSVQRAIDRCLQLKDPSYTQNEVPDYEKVLEAGQFTLLDDMFDPD